MGVKYPWPKTTAGVSWKYSRVESKCVDEQGPSNER